jgi:hypothetical protein
MAKLDRTVSQQLESVSKALTNRRKVGLDIRRITEPGQAPSLVIVNNGILSDVSLMLRQDKLFVTRERGPLETMFNPKLWFTADNKEVTVLGGPAVARLWKAMPKPEALVFTYHVSTAGIEGSRRARLHQMVEVTHSVMERFAKEIMATSPDVDVVLG